MQLSFEGMFEEIDKELQERSSRITIEHVKDCKESCTLSKRDKSHKDVKIVTEVIDFLIDYFKKYSPDSIWGKWIQDYYHVKVPV